MGVLKQDGRVAELITPFGKDVLALMKFDGVEALGELFEFHVEALSEAENINFDKALGQSCTIKLKAYEGKVRIFDGILAQAQWVGKSDDFFHYRLILRPWFWMLGYKADCRIFLDKDVKEIIREVFTKDGFNDFEFRTTADYDKIAYCVQYRETDLFFCHRLMEEYGIYYFFEHAEGKHTMVLADSPSSHRPNPQVPKLPFIYLRGVELRLDQHLYGWISDRRFRTGKVEFNDYDYLKPNKKLRAPNEASEKYAFAKLEVYDYPGKYDEESKGKKFSKFRLEAEQAVDHRRFVDGDAASLFPGSVVAIERHPVASENQDYLVVRANHRFGTQHYRSGWDKEVDQVYHGSYEFITKNHPFRILPDTPKPCICGIQTAKVVGKKGEESEEISTDENGHIWVQFFWDREPKKSCPVRVAHAWSGKKWGTQFIPRVGMEVAVAYLEGDPDRPLVIGCIYNGDNKYPYDLPAHKTQSGTKSDSTKGHNGYNEFMFEDKKGSELIRMHAQQDHLVVINANQTGKVGTVDLDSPALGGDQTWTVGGNRSWTIQKGDDSVEVQMGSQITNINMGAQSTTAMISIEDSVLMSSVTVLPATVNTEAPMINRLSQTMINDTAGAMINITAPIIHLNGMVLINGMVPVVIPIPVG